MYLSPAACLFIGIGLGILLTLIGIVVIALVVNKRKDN
jgi:hypothetical protein